MQVSTKIIIFEYQVTQEKEQTTEARPSIYINIVFNILKLIQKLKKVKFLLPYNKNFYQQKYTES